MSDNYRLSHVGKKSEVEDNEDQETTKKNDTCSPYEAFDGHSSII